MLNAVECCRVLWGTWISLVDTFSLTIKHARKIAWAGRKRRVPHRVCAERIRAFYYWHKRDIAHKSFGSRCVIAGMMLVCAMYLYMRMHIIIIAKRRKEIDTPGARREHAERSSVPNGGRVMHDRENPHTHTRRLKHSKRNENIADISAETRAPDMCVRQRRRTRSA